MKKILLLMVVLPCFLACDFFFPSDDEEPMFFDFVPEGYYAAEGTFGGDETIPMGMGIEFFESKQVLSYWGGILPSSDGEGESEDLDIFDFSEYSVKSLSDTQLVIGLKTTMDDEDPFVFNSIVTFVKKGNSSFNVLWILDEDMSDPKDDYIFSDMSLTKEEKPEPYLCYNLNEDSLKWGNLEIDFNMAYGGDTGTSLKVKVEAKNDEDLSNITYPESSPEDSRDYFFVNHLPIGSYSTAITLSNDEWEKDVVFSFDFEIFSTNGSS